MHGLSYRQVSRRSLDRSTSLNSLSSASETDVEMASDSEVSIFFDSPRRKPKTFDDVKVEADPENHPEFFNSRLRNNLFKLNPDLRSPLRTISNVKHRRKNVQFLDTVQVVLIPCRSEYKTCEPCLAPELWWDGIDYRRFQESALQEMHQAMIECNMDGRQASKHLYRGLIECVSAEQQQSDHDFTPNALAEKLSDTLSLQGSGSPDSPRKEKARPRADGLLGDIDIQAIFSMSTAASVKSPTRLTGQPAPPVDELTLPEAIANIPNVLFGSLANLQ